MKAGESECCKKEKHIFSLMVRIFCRGNHGRSASLCAECAALEIYAHSRLAACSHMDCKPFCSACQTQCYRPEQRAAVRAVMRYSGPRMLFYHPIALVRHALSGFASRNKSLK